MLLSINFTNSNGDTIHSQKVENAEYIPNMGEMVYCQKVGEGGKNYFVHYKECHYNDKFTHVVIICQTKSANE